MHDYMLLCFVFFVRDLFKKQMVSAFDGDPPDFFEAAQGDFLMQEAASSQATVAWFS